MVTGEGQGCERVNNVKREISISPAAVRVINEILNNGNAVQISLVGSRLRITEQRKGNVKYDVMIPDGGNDRHKGIE